MSHTPESRIPRPVRWSADGRAVELLDQTLLPAEERYLRLESAEEVARAIREMKVRGAPAIGIAGAFGLALGMARAVEEAGGDGETLDDRLTELRDSLESARPTGRNLGWALERSGRTFVQALESGAEPAEAARALRDEAEAIAEEDAAMCRRIGEAGLDLLPPAGEGVLTHCNAGALATGGLGTALAPFYEAKARGRAVRVFASETRPFLQGARLTAWELTRGGVEATVVTDLATGALMKEGKVRAVIVGADRIAANGDVANKIGTYALAVLARHHGLPFYVAAPRSTFDPRLASGEEIPIEERDPEEVRGISGRETAPREAGVWNPAFDVTPAHLVTAFVTDGGILRPPYDVAIAALLGEVGEESASPAARDSARATAEENP
ncbi:MAG: S-methyl-5-thioribose-1-phosphate isomerase [Gemmatimonadetes bacterium]|nr:S-methyl-5-thioribose-1-phosphate isomerase [Gemmatimonadota bacterium]NIR76835.1 S-methyl-5-thioribose-1-phosphate isomerase [Gemmatimonadota bacterium]NIT85354.1 S-methyl-5-thioribose-1-phosphate isomerase [Gemmatimonadota bacterium]NIU29175.1 S-methyl-5-thioribose-1-phosphate isomerase [Gemmatimonadota bacterium]NIU34272.1 S-methyl-5-thioribose-1-phosphate isomerase [Gemmatimonadota bacterium]